MIIGISNISVYAITHIQMSYLTIYADKFYDLTRKGRDMGDRGSCMREK